MKKWDVTVRAAGLVWGYRDVEVEAETEAEAREKAVDRARMQTGGFVICDGVDDRPLWSMQNLAIEFIEETEPPPPRTTDDLDDGIPF